jgi:putative heme-binding domain-containing protein
MNKLAALIASVIFSPTGFAVLANDVIPHRQDKPPGPALRPAEAIAKMQLPPGFSVEVVAAEPDVVNPTSFTFDDRGRIWLTESVEYPRRSPGAGQDRVKILEDTDGDGRFEKVTIFKDGLNIPCGVAVGNGGVYVTNSPDILFLKDTDGDDKADTSEVILTGFGRDDTHELPNSLTWGPDGWLYGLNGVFNRSRVTSPADGKVYDFTCALWRYDPLAKKFELFCEGTSNPWGLDYNRDGDWFVSACVIDHLWHLTQSGYYIRQGGPYPPLTQKLGSIKTMGHQAAAYSGLCLYDADVYPEAFRGKLLMGNLHGSCLNLDKIERNGSTYKQSAEPDFLSANDPWFMPVSQKVGPDGCVYLMDWYDRYHCYQDANRDPPGLDRLNGRIYRLRYQDAPRAKPFDLRKSSAEQLLSLLSHPNVWWRRTAQRVLNERFTPELVPPLEQMALDPTRPNNASLHALWLLVSRHKVEEAFHLQLLASEHAPTRKWGVRAVGEAGECSKAVFDKLIELAAKDASPDVRLQIPIAAGRLLKQDPMPLFAATLSNAANAADPLIPTITYNNLKPLVGTRAKEILAMLGSNPTIEKAFGKTTVAWVKQAINAGGRTPKEVVAELSKVVTGEKLSFDLAAERLQDVIDSVGTAGLKGEERAALFDAPTRAGVVKAMAKASLLQATTVALWWGDKAAVANARELLNDPWRDSGTRAALLKVLAEARDPGNVPAFAAMIGDANVPILIRQAAVDALGSLDDPAGAAAVVKAYPTMPPDLKPMAVNALTHSPAGGLALMGAVESKAVPAGDVTANHARQLVSLNDDALTKRVNATWGKVKTQRDPERVKIVRQYKQIVSKNPGDPKRGWAVFSARCAQCHTIYGAGGQVGPDLTGVGRADVEAILTNVIDPNLVIGASYFVHVAKTKKGAVFSGLLVEDSPERIVLKDGTKTETIRRADLSRLVVQELSMMPEGLEKTMTEAEFCDLVAFLLTKEPPK